MLLEARSEFRVAGRQKRRDAARYISYPSTNNPYSPNHSSNSVSPNSPRAQNLTSGSNLFMDVFLWIIIAIIILLLLLLLLFLLIRYRRNRKISYLTHEDERLDAEEALKRDGTEFIQSGGMYDNGRDGITSETRDRLDTMRTPPPFLPPNGVTIGNGQPSKTPLLTLSEVGS